MDKGQVKLLIAAINDASPAKLIRVRGVLQELQREYMGYSCWPNVSAGRDAIAWAIKKFDEGDYAAFATKQALVDAINYTKLGKALND